jgi:hypothetical protein
MDAKYNNNYDENESVAAAYWNDENVLENAITERETCLYYTLKK